MKQLGLLAAALVLLTTVGCASLMPPTRQKAPPARTSAGLACIMDGICK